MYDKLSEDIKNALSSSRVIAAAVGSVVAKPEHLLAGFASPGSKIDLSDYGISDASKRSIYHGLISSMKPAVPGPKKFIRGCPVPVQKVEVESVVWDKGVVDVWKNAVRFSQELNHFPILGTAHFLYGFLQKPDSTPAQILSAFGVTSESVYARLIEPRVPALYPGSPPERVQAYG